jgi:hypothetical protein
MNKLSKLIRRFTVPPIFAAGLLIIVYAVFPAYFGSVWQLLGGLFFLSLLPTLAYPLQKFIPHFKDRGREGQRTLAMIFSFSGYLLGTVVTLITRAPAELLAIYLAYLLCGIGVVLLNKIIRLKASGHACGIVGPIIMLIYFGLWIPALVGTLLVIPVYVASLQTRQHTAPQLLCGSMIPAICVTAACLLLI